MIDILLSHQVKDCVCLGVRKFQGIVWYHSRDDGCAQKEIQKSNEGSVLPLQDFSL